MDVLDQVLAWSHFALFLALGLVAFWRIRSLGGKLLGIGFMVGLIDTVWYRVSSLDVFAFMDFDYVTISNIGFALSFLWYPFLFAATLALGRQIVDSIDVEPRPFESPQTLDISALRCSGERAMVVVLSVLSILLVLIGIALFVSLPMLVPLVIVIATILIFGSWVSARIFRGLVLGNSAKVTPTHFSEIDTIRSEVASRLDYNKPVEIFIVEGGTVNALLARFIGTRFIVLNSELVRSMDTEFARNELKFIIAQAIGHLKAKHFRFWLVQYLIALEKLNPLFYLLYERMCHYTSDVIGLVVCGDRVAAQSALVKLTVGGEIADRTSMKDFLKQSRETRGSIGAFLSELLAQHPHLTKRLAHISNFQLSSSTDDHQALDTPIND